MSTEQPGAGHVELAVDVAPDRLPLPEDELTALLGRAIATCGLAGAVSLALVSDATMRSVNRDYHDCDAATDVLAFPLADPDADFPALPGGAPVFCAEIVVSFDTAEREAAARGVETLAEVLLYVVHGTLHLLGYDDHEPEDARRMHERTLAILGELGYQNTIEVDAG